MGYDIIIMEDCASNYGVFKIAGSEGNEYTVVFNGSEGPAHCTCKAFHFSSEGTCKHIQEIWKKACLFNPQWKDAVENPEIRPVSYVYSTFSPNTCACGGPMVYVRRAV